MKSQICTAGEVGYGFRSLPIPYIAGGQTCGDYPIHWQNLGRSVKSKILDCLGFSRHMKTMLYAEESFLLGID